MEGHWKLIVGGGGLKSQNKILEAKYEAKLEFPGGRGVPSMWGVWIFPGTAHCSFKCQVIEIKMFLFIHRIPQTITLAHNQMITML